MFLPYNPVAPTKPVRKKRFNAESEQQNPPITHQSVQMAFMQIRELDNKIKNEIPNLVAGMEMREREIESLKIICHEKDKTLVQMTADANQREKIANEQAKENERLKAKLDEIQRNTNANQGETITNEQAKDNERLKARLDEMQKQFQMK